MRIINKYGIECDLKFISDFQFFNQWSDKRNLLDLLHEQRVVKDKSDRAQKIDEFIQKGIRDQQMKWEMEQQAKALNNHQVMRVLLDRKVD